MLNIYDLIISPQSTLRNALERMTRNKKGLLFVCDEGAHLVGVVSDGDIRRAILGDTLLVAPVEAIANLDPVTARTIEEARSLLDDHSFLAIPVLDETGKIESVVVRDAERIKVIERENFEMPGGEEKTHLMSIAFIPARGGSKRFPKKNIALLAGKPLLAYAIQAAKGSHLTRHVIVSTDDLEIAEIARSFGAEVPWMRPPELAQHDTPTIDVLLHAVQWALEQYGDSIEYGLLLEPTAPLRSAELIDEAIRLLDSSDADSVVSISELPHVLNPEELLVIRDDLLAPYIPARSLDNRLLRARQEPVYVQNGLVYAFRMRRLIEKRSLYGDKTLPLVTEWDSFLDIDTPADLKLAEFKIRNG